MQYSSMDDSQASPFSFLYPKAYWASLLASPLSPLYMCSIVTSVKHLSNYLAEL